MNYSFKLNLFEINESFFLFSNIVFIFVVVVECQTVMNIYKRSFSLPTHRQKQQKYLIIILIKLLFLT